MYRTCVAIGLLVVMGAGLGCSSGAGHSRRRDAGEGSPQGEDGGGGKNDMASPHAKPDMAAQLAAFVAVHSETKQLQIQGDVAASGKQFRIYQLAVENTGGVDLAFDYTDLSVVMEGGTLVKQDSATLLLPNYCDGSTTLFPGGSIECAFAIEVAGSAVASRVRLTLETGVFVEGDVPAPADPPSGDCSRVEAMISVSACASCIMSECGYDPGVVSACNGDEFACIVQGQQSGLGYCAVRSLCATSTTCNEALDQMETGILACDSSGICASECT